MKMKFFTPAYGVAGEFGAATFGFVGAENEKDKNSIDFSTELDGIIVKGTYKECLENIPDGNWQAGVVLLGNAGNENEFVRAVAEKVKAPLTGGGAAINPETGEKGLITGQNEAAVFLINDDRYNVEVEYENIHHDILSKHEIKYTARFIDTIDGCEPKAWLAEKKQQLGLDKCDFEHLTLADESGINAHLSEVDGKIFSGRDLSDVMYLRYVPKSEVQNRMQKFYDDKCAVIFGCAGLKGILDKNLECNGVGLFMFGEICTVNSKSDFGNLMLSKLKVTKK